MWTWPSPSSRRVVLLVTVSTASATVLLATGKLPSCALISDWFAVLIGLQCPNCLFCKTPAHHSDCEQRPWHVMTWC